ncbi:hypothetical protein B0H19DRAFT_1170377 [Mycena capillaripes]|nr:hypothetical protein B0H19DRAFT_1170377 [Mycena capillaripes]
MGNPYHLLFILLLLSFMQRPTEEKDSVAGNLDLFQTKLDKMKLDLESELNKTLDSMKIQLEEFDKMRDEVKTEVEKLKLEQDKEKKERESSHDQMMRMLNGMQESRLEDADVLEARESVALCLDSFSDIVFAVEHRITVHGRTVEDMTLYDYELEHITDLLDPENAPHCSPAVEAARLRALSVLPDAELRFCEALATALYRIRTTRYIRNPTLNHPAVIHSMRPDRATALRRVLEVIDETHRPTLEKFLATDPKRKAGYNKNEPLFAPDGTYTSVLEQRREFEESKAKYKRGRV